VSEKIHDSLSPKNNEGQPLAVPAPFYRGNVAAMFQMNFFSCLALVGSLKPVFPPQKEEKTGLPDAIMQPGTEPSDASRQAP
jgi:hypothetical protein